MPGTAPNSICPSMSQVLKTLSVKRAVATSSFLPMSIRALKRLTLSSSVSTHPQRRAVSALDLLLISSACFWIGDNASMTDTNDFNLPATSNLPHVVSPRSQNHPRSSLKNRPYHAGPPSPCEPSSRLTPSPTAASISSPTLSSSQKEQLSVISSLLIVS